MENTNATLAVCAADPLWFYQLTTEKKGVFTVSRYH